MKSTHRPNLYLREKTAEFFGSNSLPLGPSTTQILHVTMALAYQTVKSDDEHLNKMESELQAAILTNGYISVEAVKGLVQYGIINCEKFHILGTKDNIPHSQLLLGTSSRIS